MRSVIDRNVVMWGVTEYNIGITKNFKAYKDKTVRHTGPSSSVIFIYYIIYIYIWII